MFYVYFLLYLDSLVLVWFCCFMFNFFRNIVSSDLHIFILWFNSVGQLLLDSNVRERSGVCVNLYFVTDMKLCRRGLSEISKTTFFVMYHFGQSMTALRV